MAENERLIADIMGAQARLQHLFAYDRSDPLFSSHLTISQLKILLLLTREGAVSGGALAGLMGVSLATLSAMIDRLVAQDLVARHEDARDRRVRRIALTPAGAELVGNIITAGAEKQRRMLSRLELAELRVVQQAMAVLVRAAAAGFDAGDAPPACSPAPAAHPASDRAAQPAQTQPAQTQPAQTQPAQTQPAQTQSSHAQSSHAQSSHVQSGQA